MSTIFPEGRIQRISTEQNQNFKQGPIQGPDADQLALIFSFHSGSYIIALTTPLHVGSQCLKNKHLVTASIIKEAFECDESFDPLRSETKDIPGNRLSSDEITLLSYFFLNINPFSISMISDSFSEIHSNPERAIILAEAAYTARTGRNESEPGFFKSFCQNKCVSQEFIIKNKLYLTPGTLNEAILLLQNSEEQEFVYDCLSYESPDHSKTIPLINLAQIDESGFLVEDHSTLIVGLAVNITDLAKISEDKWPIFYDKLLNAIPLYLRDFYSLGRLINEKPAILRLLATEYHCETEIISIAKNGEKYSVSLKDPDFGFKKHERTKGIPLFMQIHK